MVLIFEKEIKRVIRAYGPQSGRPNSEKDRFYNEMSCKWDLQNLGEMVFGLDDFNRHVERRIDSFENVHGWLQNRQKNLEGKALLEFHDKKKLCVANTWFGKGKRKTTYSTCGNKTEIDFVLVRKSNKKYLEDVKVISWELQCRFVETDADKKSRRK